MLWLVGIIVFLHQLTDAIKTQLKAPKAPYFLAFCCFFTAWGWPPCTNMIYPRRCHHSVSMKIFDHCSALLCLGHWCPPPPRTPPPPPRSHWPRWRTGGWRAGMEPAGGFCQAPTCPPSWETRYQLLLIWQRSVLFFILKIDFSLKHSLWFNPPSRTEYFLSSRAGNKVHWLS